jgi:hypothetical protein
MSDMDDMDESTEATGHWLGPQGRRAFLTKAAAAGAIAWATPVILSRPAWAVEGGGGTRKCRPTITVTCSEKSCQQGGKHFPGFTVTVGNCPCSTATKQPATCIQVTGLNAPGSSTCTDVLQAYAATTQCEPNPPVTDAFFPVGTWKCATTPTQSVFFGKARSGNGAISNLSSCVFSFTLGVWAGKCPDATGVEHAYNCQTYKITIDWDSAADVIRSCTIQSTTPSLCTSGNVAPCTCP